MKSSITKFSKALLGRSENGVTLLLLLALLNTSTEVSCYFVSMSSPSSKVGIADYFKTT